MMCRSQNCGAEGLFHKTEGYCPRCYEEKEATRLQDADPTGYYERKARSREELLPLLFWIAILTFVIFIGRALWLVIFE